MSAAFEDTLYLFSCAALGKTPRITHNIDVREIYNISRKQGIWGIVFLSLKQLYEKNEISVDKETFEKWNTDFLRLIAMNIKKQAVINKVFRALGDNDIDAYVLKGSAVACFYDEPLSRVSGDTDIYVGGAKIEEAERVFEQCGFEVFARSPMAHHTVCKHPVGGSVDLHLTFHDDTFEDKFFCGYTDITEDGISYRYTNHTFKTLGVTDNAIFLFLHLVKHFLSCGTGIRQIMDFLLFWKNNRQNIDGAKFKKMLDELGFSNLYASCVKIGLSYLQFNENDIGDFGYTADDFFTDWILSDIEQGGVFGKLEQRHLTIQYLFGENGVPVTKSKRYYVKMYLNTFKYGYLSKKYPYLKKTKLLMPVAYINRIYDLAVTAYGVFKTIRKANVKNDEYGNIVNRMNFIRMICINTSETDRKQRP